MIVTMSFDAFNPNDDKKDTMEDGQEVWICNYNNSHTPLPPTPPVPNETTDLSATISGNINLKNGYRRTYSVQFTNKEGLVVNWKNVNFTWNIVSSRNINQELHENKIELFVDEEGLIGSSFLLQILINDKVVSEIEINIIE